MTLVEAFNQVSMNNKCCTSQMLVKGEKKVSHSEFNVDKISITTWQILVRKMDLKVPKLEIENNR